MITKAQRLIFFTLAYLAHLSYTNECISLDISLTQKVEHEGFHRDIKWLLEVLPQNIDKLSRDNCIAALQLEVNSGMFVNPDQIADLNRLNELSAHIDVEVNVESITHDSEPHTVYVFVPTPIQEKTLLKLPIHLRYQRAQITGSFSKVVLPKPSLLMRCANSDFCSKQETISAPCNLTASENCVWRNVTYNALFDEVEMYVPIGDLDDYAFVSVITLLLGCAGCIYVLSILSTSPL